MDELIKKLASDKETQDKFIEFAHTREEEIKKVSQKAYEDLNKFVMESILEYAKQNNIELVDDSEVKEKTAAICKKVADDFESNLVDMFRKSFKQS